MHQPNQNMFLARSLFILFTIACAPRALADVWTVDDDGPADFSTIQAAIDAANDGDVIHVAPGEYTGTGENVIDFLGKDLEIIGAGAFDPPFPDPELTTIRGQGIRRGALVNCGPGASPRLEGLLFVNCFTTGDGGGVRITSDKVQVTDCIFDGCVADGRGGGLFANGCSDARFEFLYFVRCLSDLKPSSLYVSNSTVLALSHLVLGYGEPDDETHGLYFQDSVITDTPPNAGPIASCAFEKIEAPGLVLDGSTLESATEFEFRFIHQGPAVILKNGSSAQFVQSTFLDLDRGIQATGTAFSLDLEQCSLRRINQAVGIYGSMETSNQMKTVRIANCKFKKCRMRTVWAERAEVTIEDSLIEKCGGTEDDEFGGTSAGGLMAQVTASKHAQLYLTRTKFTGNQGGIFGGAVQSWEAFTVVDECIFTDNRAGLGTYADWGKGGGLFCFGGELTVKNNTAFDHNQATYGGAICIQGGGDYPIWAVIEDTHFTQNEVLPIKFDPPASGGSMGGAIYLTGSSVNPVTVRRCYFSTNTARSGGAIAQNGSGSMNLILQDSKLNWNAAKGPANDAETAGGVALIGSWSSSAVLENNKFLCNTPKHISPNCALLPGNTFSGSCGHWKIWIDGPHPWVWNIDWKSGRVYEVFEQPLQISKHAERALGPDGLLYAAEFDAMRVSRWDPTNGEHMGYLVDPDMGLAPVAVGFSGEQAVVLDGGGALFLMDPESGTVLSVLEGGSTFPADLGMGPDGLAYVLTQDWSSGPSVQVWDLQAGVMVQTLADNSFWLEVAGDVSVLPDGRVLVSDEAAGAIHQFDGASGAYMGLFMDSGQNADLGLGWLRDLVVAPDGSLYMATESGIHLFDAEGNYRKPLLVNGAPALANKLIFLPPKTAPTPPSMK